MDYLAYQYPNQTKQIKRGKWVEEELDKIPEECFFVSTFEKEKTFYFREEEYTDSPEDFFLHRKEDVFIANGRSFLFGLDNFKAGFEDRGIEKAIYSRIKLEEKKGVKVEDIFHQLAKKYKKEALVYLISSPHFGTWMGATPEILLSGNEAKMQSIALAGTKSKKDAKWTKKEEEEHQFVIDDIGERLKKFPISEVNISPTQTVKNGKVYHLRTDFQFSISKNCWNELLKELHPTPAICGTPRELALAYILAIEPHERLFYTGMIGQKSKNQLEVYVNLRCMQILQEGYALYVGGGITKSSDLAKEWEETEDKSETLLSVILGED